MKEFNFNTIKNLPVPEQWIENALAIPETEEQKPAVVPLSNGHCEESAEPMTRQSQPFWRKPRFIALAASLVLVTALSISLFLSMGSKPPIAVKSDSKPDSTQIVWSTDEYGATVATEVVVIPGDGDPNGTAPTEKRSAIEQFFENVFGTDDRTTPTAPSGQNGASSQNGRTPQSPSAAPQDPTAAPSPVTPDPTAAPRPIETDPPHEPETAPPEEPPTEAPCVNPSEPSWEMPTEAPSEVQSVINAWLSVSAIPEDGKVYCKVISMNTGKLYGNYGEYDDERLMTPTYKGSDYWYYSYNCRQYFDIPKVFQANEVIFYVYDSEGTVLYSEITYLGSWV